MIKLFNQLNVHVYQRAYDFNDICINDIDLFNNFPILSLSLSYKGSPHNV